MALKAVLVLSVILVLLVPGLLTYSRRRRSSCSLVNCQWSSWSHYSSSCGSPCGGGGEKYYRRYHRVSASCGGASCTGSTTKTEPCTGSCSGHGTWFSVSRHCFCNTGYIGTCCDSIVRCPTLPSPGNGRFSTYANTYRTTSSLLCNTGYEPRFSGTWTCLSNGRWTPSVQSYGSCRKVRCPGISTLGGTASSGYEYGDVKTFTCRSGYEMSGSSRITCRASGTWSSSAPTCNRVSCPALSAPVHGRVVDSSGHSYNDYKRFGCDAGYAISGSSSRTCTASRTWTGTQPVCNRISCSVLQAPPNGLIQGTSLNGDTVRYSCDAKYELIGNRTRTCQSNRMWTGSQPTCVEKRCPHVAQSPNGQMNIGTLVGDVLRFNCNPGYHLVGNSPLLCQDDKTWNGTWPSCEKIACPTPEVPQNGNLTGEVLFGDTVTFTCDVGYKINGSFTTECLATGVWSNTLPRCERITCPKISPPEHGAVVGGHCSGDVVTYTCNIGYDLIGSPSRTCQENEQWTGSQPTCKLVQCSKLNPPLHGAMIDGINYNDTVHFSCAPGYHLTGSSNRTCQADGLWSGTQPTCSGLECPELDTPLNGQKTGGTSVGSFVIFFCHEGYDLSGGDIMRTCRTNQTWTGTQPSCQRKSCPELPAPLNGNKTGSNLYGDVVTFTCAPGYNMTGDQTRTCQGDARWSGTQPSCSRVQCPSLSPIPNGQMSGGTLFGQLVSFVCNSGYELSGSSSRMCQSDGSWSGVQPFCVPMNCSQLTPPPHGNIEGGNLLGDAAVYTCAEGYEIQGSVVRFCMPGQTWSGEETTCQRKKCPQLEPPLNGRINGTNFLGNTVNFNCDEGYDLVGSPSLTCERNSGWSGAQPYCEKIRCPDPVAPLNGVVSGGSYYGDVVSYSCCSEYELSGNSTRKCQADGQWSGSEPACDKKQCPPLNAPANGNLTGGFSYGDQVTFTCQYGFQLSNSDVRVCEDNGVWGGIQPTCDVVECTWLQTPPNSNMTMSGNTFGDTASTTCDPGYTLVGGDNFRTCLANGQWSGSQALCQKTCCMAPSLQNGNYNGTTCFNDTVSVQCEEGYYLASPDSDLTCTELGTWDKPIPQCERTCCDTSVSMTNGHVAIPSGNCFGSMALVTCDEGYKVPGNTGILYCNASGVWEGEDVRCERTNCGDPGEIRQGQKTLTGTFYGDTVTYTCDPGFVLVGNASSTCNKDGYWGPSPFCEANDLCNRTHLSAPKDGWKVCFESPEGTTPVDFCRMHCNSPLEYNRNEAMYECSVDTAWRWQVRRMYSGTTFFDILPVGDCSPPMNPFVPLTVGGLIIEAGQPLDMQAIEDEMKYQLGQLGLCFNPCEIGTITVEQGARRRSGGIQYQINVQLRAYADPALITPTNTLQMEWVRIAGELRHQAMHLQTLVQSGGLSLSVGGQTLPVGDNGITISNPSLGCKEGQIMQGVDCFPCGPGTYHDVFDSVCRPCGYASYQDEFGQTSCKPCPDKATTQGPGAKNISDCKVFDDCNCGIHPCILNATGYFCHCLTGYRREGDFCIDIDECEDPTICPNAECINRPGSYSCQCLPGYDGAVCSDVDECRYAGFCPDHSTCTNTEGDYYCTCDQGYQGDNCEDLNECHNASLNTCGPNQLCINTVGSFQCEDCTVFDGKCYIASDARGTFAEAEAKCAEDGGILATVKDQQVQDFLVQLLSVSSMDVWIGLTDLDVEGQFVWTDGSPLVYSNWAPGEPNGDGNTNCVHLWPLANFRWDDMPCGRSNYYVCQYNMA